MADLSAVGVSKYFGERKLFGDVSFEVYRGEHVSLIGPNGCGKSTLFKMIAGEMPYDGGSISSAPGIKIGILEQLPDYPPEMTVRDVLMIAFDDLRAMEAEMRELETRMGEGNSAVMAKYAALQTAFEAAGGYDPEYRYNMMTKGLDISEEMQARSFMSLSGGERTRISLARIMLSGAEMLLLDEPTNHLDIGSIEWLEDYIKGFKGSVIVISHDRYFLDKVTTRTLEVDDTGIVSWKGNYSYYIDKKQEQIELQEAARKRQEKEIERLDFTLQRMKGWGLGDKKMMRRAFALEKRIQRIERIDAVKKQRKMNGRFTEADRSGDEVYYLENLSSGYDDPLVKDFSAIVLRGERIALLGPNGCGKTTLLNTILGKKTPLKGSVYVGSGVKTGLLPQVVEFRDPEKTLFETLLYLPGCTPQDARDRLAAFEFKGEDVFKQVKTLSGGEKTRLRLCVFMQDKINTLFLDEPTNHLDIITREWIEEAIDDFSETMIFVSHDRYFIDRFATRIWYIENGSVTDFPGPYSAFLESRKRQDIYEKAAEKKKKEEDPVKKQSPDKRKKELLKETASIEKALEDIEREMGENPDNYQRLTELSKEKEEKEARLLECYEMLED